MQELESFPKVTIRCVAYAFSAYRWPTFCNGLVPSQALQRGEVADAGVYEMKFNIHSKQI
jgi:hypothetical protein